MGNVYRLFNTLVCLIPALFLTFQAQAAREDFPVPDNLRSAVDFWVRVYTEVDTSRGFLHDAENLSVVYAALERDRDTINDRRRQIAEDLRTLASGTRTALTPSEQRILSLWPANVSNERLARAANNIRWQLGQSDRFLAGLRRSGAYRRHIESVIEAKGMPRELASLPHVESSFHPGAYSSAAATGMWQFVRSTAQRFMRVDHVVDERLDPYAATQGAMELLEYNYNALGTWPLALTAYNHGANGMARAVNVLGTRDIGAIIRDYSGPRFGFASRNFYPQFLAVLEVESRAQAYFGSIDYDRHPEFTTLELDDYVDARALAETLGVGFRDLRRSNPALQPAVWSGTKRIPKGYTLKIDRASYGGSLARAFASLPAGARHGEQIPDVSYTVSRGDSLSLIAQRYDSSVSELVAINQLRDRHRIRIGQVILLPQPDGSIPNLAGNGRAWEIPADGKYEVQSGDTLSLIADRFRVPEETLLSLNRMEDPNLIYPGQTLSLQASAAPAPQSRDVGGESTASPAQQARTETEGRAELAARTLPAVSDTLAGVPDDAVQLASLEQDTGESGSPRLARLSVDSNNAAIEVDAATQEAEAQRQLIMDLSSDPSDYSVGDDNTIEIQAAETLGHYAEWLGIRAWDLRRLNGMSYGQPVISGRRLKLDFSEVDAEAFERRRREYHRDLQAGYFNDWRIKGTEKYRIRRRDLLVNLARSRSVPLWLLRQYNPDIDSSRIQIGQEVVFPVVERADG